MPRISCIFSIFPFLSYIDNIPLMQYPTRNAEDAAMTDIYALLRTALSTQMSALLHVHIEPSMIDCTARNYGARCAAPCAFHADAHEWAARIEHGMFTFFQAPLLARADANNGHLLFTFSHEFYTHILRLILEEQEKKPPLPTAEEGDTSLFAHTAYVQRRMWMVARRAKGEAHCPPHDLAQRALFQTAGIFERGISHVARMRRLQESQNALLGMLRGAQKRERPAHFEVCAHVCDAAARLLHTAYSAWKE